MNMLEGFGMPPRYPVENVRYIQVAEDPEGREVWIKFYVKKMVDLRLVAKVPHKRLYQKYPNATNFSNWLRDLLKLALEPLENGQLTLPEDDEDED
jgi:hypothetical protein